MNAGKEPRVEVVVNEEQGLPVAMTDAYFDTEEEARAEARRRKSKPVDEYMIVRCERTGYGNWRVRSIPADLMLDMLALAPAVDTPIFGLRSRTADWKDR